MGGASAEGEAGSGQAADGVGTVRTSIDSDLCIQGSVQGPCCVAAEDDDGSLAGGSTHPTCFPQSPTPSRRIALLHFCGQAPEIQSPGVLQWQFEMGNEVVQVSGRRKLAAVMTQDVCRGC